MQEIVCGLQLHDVHFATALCALCNCYCNVHWLCTAQVWMHSTSLWWPQQGMVTSIGAYRPRYHTGHHTRITWVFKQDMVQCIPNVSPNVLPKVSYKVTYRISHKHCPRNRTRRHRGYRTGVLQGIIMYQVGHRQWHQPRHCKGYHRSIAQSIAKYITFKKRELYLSSSFNHQYNHPNLWSSTF